ncbi:MAG TPA: 2-phospho-L-lactate transferase [Acidimicrobiales bacterium]|nr:2-phospho-L-lactate transferase [Acidimicrobiales bacterium]
MSRATPTVTALAGGVGAARMLRGLAAVVGQQAITAVINTGDDAVLHGLYVSPDIDTVTYTLGGVANPATGWGLATETWRVMAGLREFETAGVTPRAGLTWFSLGDTDLATHLYRTGRLAAGAGLSQVTAEVAARFGVKARLLPMSDERVETRVTVDMGERATPFAGPGVVEIGFQEYFVGLGHGAPVRQVRFAGAEAANPAPGVLAAIGEAEMLVICPSNPIVSIGPLMSVPGIADAVARRRDSTVAVSPIVAGKALKGPADRMLVELGHEASVVGVAEMWAPLAATLVVDDADAGSAARVEAQGVRCVVAPAIMTGATEAATLARAVLGAGRRRAG